MSSLASILQCLQDADTILESYNRNGALVRQVSGRELVKAIRAHRSLFSSWPHKDHRIAFLFKADETVEFLAAIFAAMAERLTVIPLYPTWSEAQMRTYLSRYRLRSIVVGEGFQKRVEGWGDLVDTVLAGNEGGWFPPPAAGGDTGGEEDSAGSGVVADEPFPHDLPQDHPCAQIFTSGTSGDLSKCTMITQANLVAAVEGIARLDFLHPGMVLHCPLSASHIFAFVVILGFLAIKPRRVIFSDIQYLAKIPQEKIGKIDGVVLVPLVLNRMRAAFYERLLRPELFSGRRGTVDSGKGNQVDSSLARLLAMPPRLRRGLKWMVERAETTIIAREEGLLRGWGGWPLVLLTRRLVGGLVRRRLSSPQFVVVGGAKPNLRSMAFLEVMGIRCLQGWGMTETTGPLAVCGLGDRFRGAFGTCGEIFRGSRAYLQGEELVVEGPQIASGYVEPDGTLVPFDGRVHTGDHASFDRRGRLKVLGKVSDRITLSNGINYNPIHFEERIQSHDLRREHFLEETVFIGDGQNRLGCVFFLREPHRPCEAIRDYLLALVKEVNASLSVDEQIGPWVVSPRYIQESDVLGPSAKIIRRRVEEQYTHIFLEGRGARVDGRRVKA